MANECYYWVYILECENATFYTGYTANLLTRYRSHVTGKGKCKYTRSFKPRYLAQCWPIFGTKAQAMKVERFLKNLSHAEKKELILNPHQLAKIFLDE